MLAIANRERCDLLIRLEPEQKIHFSDERERRVAFDTLAARGAEFGVVAFECTLVDEHDARHEPGLARIPEPARGVLLGFPSIGRVNDEPPVLDFDNPLPTQMFVDAAGRPFATIELAGAVVDAELRARIERVRAVRHSRDEAFAAAAVASGKERMACLQRALAALDRWLVVRCYAAELAELAASGEAAAVAYASPLLHEHRVLQACRSLRTASEEIRTIDARRLRRQLDEVVHEFHEVPDVTLIALCVHASVELRLAIDEKDRDRIVERVRAAADAVEGALPWLQQFVHVWTFEASRWRPR